MTGGRFAEQVGYAVCGDLKGDSAGCGHDESAVGLMSKTASTGGPERPSNRRPEAMRKL